MRKQSGREEGSSLRGAGAVQMSGPHGAPGWGPHSQRGPGFRRLELADLQNPLVKSLREGEFTSTQGRAGAGDAKRQTFGPFADRPGGSPRALSHPIYCPRTWVCFLFKIEVVGLHFFPINSSDVVYSQTP